MVEGLSKVIHASRKNVKLNNPCLSYFMEHIVSVICLRIEEMYLFSMVHWLCKWLMSKNSVVYFHV